MEKILFVCLGNICRSPIAEAVFRTRVSTAGLENIQIDSAGTGDWHIGNPPDPRAIAEGAHHNYDLSQIRARQVNDTDFHTFTHILAMDQANLRALKQRAPARHAAKIGLFLDYAEGPDTDVPDPYFGAAAGFETVRTLIEDASDGLIRALQAARS